jgi:septation ring formation regulator EzrA
MEASSLTIDRLMHTLQEIQLSNSSPQIPFNLIFNMIRGSANEITNCQRRINELTEEVKKLKEENEELKKKTV